MCLDSLVIASEAKQSIGQQRRHGLLRRFVPGNDEKTLILFQFATHFGRGLSSGTSPERIAPESVTPMLSAFVHRNISR
jgi:hypothetical protein